MRYTCDMADCNIRNVDPALIDKMKTAAAMRGMTLRAWIIRLMEEAAQWVPLLDGKPIELLTPISTEAMAVLVKHTPFKRSVTDHADNCKCFICKPPNADKKAPAQPVNTSKPERRKSVAAGLLYHLE